MRCMRGRWSSSARRPSPTEAKLAGRHCTPTRLAGSSRVAGVDDGFDALQGLIDRGHLIFEAVILAGGNALRSLLGMASHQFAVDGFDGQGLRCIQSLEACDGLRA